MEEINRIINSPEYKVINDDVELFIKEKISTYRPEVTAKKTIHDPVWGSIDYSDWEMQLIDSPLFQRLRDINQVGLAMLTYPAARHSRFEHSLGVASAAKRMCNRIEENTTGFKLAEEDRDCIILAALLHDIGHCFYSHLSETIYGELKDFTNLRKVFYDVLELKPKPHEILSFVIVNTETFKNFFFKYIDYPHNSNVTKYLFRYVGCMIIGQNIEKPGEVLSYMTSIINGPFDADKLDYIKRDSHTAGLALQYDIERLFTKIQVHEIVAGKNSIEKRLVIDFNGITAIEELTFCKIMLFSYIYYHQKVLISEAMIKDYVYGLYELQLIDSLSDFLRYTDSDILKLATKQKDQKPFPEYGNLNLEILSENIRNRKLPKRCFEVSQSTVIYLENKSKDEQSDSKEDYKCIMNKMQNSTINYSAENFIKDINNILFSSFAKSKKETIFDRLIIDLRELTYKELLDKRKEFCDALIGEYKKYKKKINFDLFDIYIVFPRLVNYGSTTDAFVLGKDQQNLMTINDFVKLDDWAGSFNSNKWRGYIFISNKVDKAIAYKVSEKFVLKGKAKLNNPNAYLKDINLN